MKVEVNLILVKGQDEAATFLARHGRVTAA